MSNPFPEPSGCLEVLRHLVNTQMAFVYLNHKNEIEPRRVAVKHVFFGVKEPYYREPQWLFDALDLDRQAVRTFAFVRICPDEASAIALRDGHALPLEAHQHDGP